jgi:hypothetical protein
VDGPKRGALGEGAAQAAPTAPHATPRLGGGPRSGPERFWARWPVRVALGLCLVISGVAHCAVVPFEVPRGFQVNDVEGEAAIPVDLLAEDETPPAPPPEVPIAQSKVDLGEGKQPLAAVLHPDAGNRRDANVPDAASDASDGSAETGLAGPGTDGAVALADGGAGSGPRDPQAIVGAAGAIQADVVLVMLVVNAEVIRANPVGARMGLLLRGIPQWDEFMSGTEIDPVRDIDWLMISGPSLINTARDVVLVRYAASDSIVDHAIDVVSRKYDRGGRIDSGVPGVRASLAHADRAERVLLRPQAHVLAVVPPSVAEKVARQLALSRVPAHVRPGEAAYLRLVNPHHPMPEIPESITEFRVRVVPRSDEGADVFVDGDTNGADVAAQAADDLRKVVRRHDDAFTALLTHGLLNHVEVTTDGAQVKVHLLATRDQIETLTTLVGDFLGVTLPAPVSSASASPR